MSRIVLVSEGEAHTWRHYYIPRDGGATLIEMHPALFSGWNVRCVTEYGSEAWGDMSAEAIVAWKLQNADVRVLDPEGTAVVLGMLDRLRSERAA